MTHTVYLGLGTNLGNKEQNIAMAVEHINARAGAVVRQSSLFFSEPWGFDSDNSFVNAVICIHTELSPIALLHVTQQIERLMGRSHKSGRRTLADGTVVPVYHDRIIDIDLLMYDNLHLSSPELTLPHPHIQDRDFVRLPLAEIL